MSESLFDQFNRLPLEMKLEIMRLLKQAMLWRGHRGLGGDKRLPSMTHGEVEKIAAVFGVNGMEQEEYT